METFSLGEEVLVSGKLGIVHSIDDKSKQNLPVLIKLSSGEYSWFTLDGRRGVELHIAIKKIRPLDVTTSGR